MHVRIQPLIAGVLAHADGLESQIEKRAVVAGTVSVEIRLRSIWLAILFIWLWDFSPGFGVPLYFHQTTALSFTQSFIGILTALNAAGMVAGAVSYRMWLQQRQMKWQLTIAVLSGVISTLSYLLLASPESAILLELARGFSNMIAILTMYALAAKVCPPGAEVSIMAVLIAERNLATECSTYPGGLLFTHVFHNELPPLILAATATTALCFAIIPFIARTQAKS